MRPNLAVLRSAIGPMLTETGIVTRAGEGEPVMDPITGQYDDPPPITVYSGPLLIQPEGDAAVVAFPGGTIPVRQYDITFPHDADVSINNVLTVTACFGDPELVGQQIGITDVRHDSWQPARYCKGKLAGTA